MWSLVARTSNCKQAAGCADDVRMVMDGYWNVLLQQALWAVRTSPLQGVLTTVYISGCCPREELVADGSAVGSGQSAMGSGW